MSGLLTKDFRLLFGKKSLMIGLFAVLGVGMFMESSFLLTFVPIFAVIVVLSTISYDEFDNGMAFLMTLPVTAKTYVSEKYLLAVIFGCTGWFLSGVIGMLASLFQIQDTNMTTIWGTMLAILPVLVIILGVLIPIELKFGAEKGRIAMLIVYGIGFAVEVLGTKLLEALGVNVENLVLAISKVPTVLLAIAVIAIIALILTGSYFISVGIMKKKEY